MKVYFGTPTHGAPRIEFVAGFILMRDYEMTKPPGEGHLVASNFEQGPYIASNRNKLVMKMYERECDALMMVDHDVHCPPETMSKMVEAMQETGLGIIAGDLILGNDARTTGFFDQTADDQDGPAGSYALAERPLVDGVPAQIGLVNAVATSCILIHRRVFDAISAVRDEPPWFGPGTWFMHWPVKHATKPYWVDTGEDFSFCKRARAAGFPVMGLYYGLGLGHHKVGRMIVEKMTGTPPTQIGVPQEAV
jgi:hypothetical protein